MSFPAEPIAVHRDAHAASGFTPLGAGFFEDAVEAFGFRLPLDLVRTRNDEHPHAGATLRPAKHSRRASKIRHPAVRAASDEHDIDRVAQQAWPGSSAMYFNACNIFRR